MLFLDGRQEQVARSLRQEMDVGVRRDRSTSAPAALRDKMRAIERTMEAQKMAGFARRRAGRPGLRAVGQRGRRPAVRHPRRQDRQPRRVPAGEPRRRPRRRGAVRVREAVLRDGRLRPAARPGAADAARRGRARGVPRASGGQQRGPDGAAAGRGQALLALAARNAAETLAREQARWLADQGRTLGALEELADALGLPAAPMRIECFDISTIQGTNTVGSMVVFEEGRPRSGEYRRFRIKTVEGTDDFASHREVLRRRFRRALESEEGSAEELRWRMPDLVIIDGGKGQVSAARGVLDELGLHDLPLAGLAKEREELFLPGRSEPIVLPATSQALYLVQRLRDEAHRFAITYHRQVRAKAQTKSALDDLPGVGPARKRALLRVFGSTGAQAGVGRRDRRGAGHRAMRWRPGSASTSTRSDGGPGREHFGHQRCRRSRPPGPAASWPGLAAWSPPILTFRSTGCVIAGCGRMAHCSPRSAPPANVSFRRPVGGSSGNPACRPC